MEYRSALESPCYIFDASSLIQIESEDSHGKGLKHMPNHPGKWLVVPSKVAREVNSESAPADTRNWLRSGKLSKFNVDSEHRLYMKIRTQEILLSDADIEGIVIAYHRNGIYVVEEGLARSIARRLGIGTMNAKQFLDKVRPHLL